jgi:hypothetical protein
MWEVVVLVIRVEHDSQERHDLIWSPQPCSHKFCGSAMSGNWNWRDVDQLNHLIATAERNCCDLK